MLSQESLNQTNQYGGNMFLIWLIIFCETGFWIFLSLGLFSRYYLNNNKLSHAFLYSVPVLDIVLIIATAIDLHQGSIAQFAHGLAAAYLGFTLIFGKSVIKWADNKVQTIFYNASDYHEERYGFDYAKMEWLSWLKAVLACSVATAFLYAAITYVNDPIRTEALTEWYGILANLLVIWLIIGPLWYTLFQKRAKKIEEN